MDKEFDKISGNYDTLLNEAVGITGFDTTYFVTAKLKALKRLFPELAAGSFNFLDFGCGPGNLYGPFESFFPNATYRGTDFSQEMIRQSRNKFPGAKVFFEIDSEEWGEKQYDIIFASGVFHHIPWEGHKKILQELKLLLTKKGQMVLWEHNPINPFTRKIVKDCAFDKDAKLIHPREMKRLFGEAAFTKSRIVYTTFFPRALEFLIPLEPYLGWLPLGGQYIAIGEN